jgi:hypothetical protein
VVADDVGEVHAALVIEDLAVVRLQVRQQQPFHVLVGERPHFHAANIALEAHHRGHSGLEVEVGRFHLHDHAKELVDLGFALDLSGGNFFAFTGGHRQLLKMTSRKPQPRQGNIRDTAWDRW